MSRSRRGPASGQKTRTDYLTTVMVAWKGKAPDWVIELAAEATRTSGVMAAKKIGYAGAVVTQVCRNKYPGDLSRVEAKVRGALMGETVTCPVLGDIGRHRCLDEQKMPFSAASSIRAKLFRACRNGCPHSRIAAVQTALKE